MKQVPEFPNYTISKDGVVHGKNEKKQTLGKNGYLYVTLYSNNVSKKLYIHRLLGLLYLDNPEGKRTINHIDGNKTNNSLHNLEWATDGENIKHAHQTGLNKGRSKVTDDHLLEIYTRFFKGESLTSISNDLPYNNVTVSNHFKKYIESLNEVDEYEEEKSRQKLLRRRARMI